MAQPLPYERDYDFQNFQSGHPSTPLPGDKVNAELDQVAATLDEVLARIALLQDDDTALKRGSVGYDQLAVGVSLGFEPPSAWLTATAYIVRDTVFQGAGFYQCLVSHTSGTFATDLAAGKWELLADFTSATADAEAAQAAAEAAQALAEAARDSATASASSASSNAASASASANSASADAEQTAADRIATAADRVATAADRVQTGLDVVSSAASAAAAAASAASIVIGPGGVQEYSANLAGVAAVSPTDGNFIVGNGTTLVAESGLTAQASLGLNTTRIATIAAGASVDLSGWSQVIVNRYASGSPLVPSLYRQVSADPGHDGAWQDSVGTWFEYVPGPAGIDVRAFGATGDGVTDDTDAIQAAIDYADGLGGGVVFFPPGDYLVSASALVESFDNGGAAVDAGEACIIQRSQVSLLGSGVGATKITVNDTGALTAIFSISPDGCFVRGMEIDGGWTQVSGSGHGIIQLQNTGPANEYCRDFSVENVYIHDCASYGIGLQNGDIENTVIRNVRIKTVGADGIDSKQRGPAQKNHGLTIDAVTVEDFGLRLDDQAGVDCHGRASLSNIHIKTFGRSGATTTGIRLRTLSTPSTEGDNARGSSLTNFIVTGTGTGDNRGVFNGSPDVTIAQGFVEGVDIGVLLSGNANGVPDRTRVVNVTATGCGIYGFQVGASISYTLFANCVAEACDTGFINQAAFTVYANCFAPNSVTAELSVTATPLSTQTLIGVGLLGTENGITQSSASTQSMLQAFGAATDIDFRIDAKNAGAVEFRSRGSRAFRAASPASAVNWLAVNSSATGVAVELNAAGSDSNIDILYRPKGTGNTRFTTGLRSEGATHGIGYGTGAGGTVAQATSKSTGVTLSKACGQITMHNATLTAGTNVSFTLTNTAIAAGDLLVLNHVSGGTVGAYALNAQCGAGSAVINVRNLTAGDLGEAIVIGYALVKAVAA